MAQVMLCFEPVARDSSARSGTVYGLMQRESMYEYAAGGLFALSAGRSTATGAGRGERCRIVAGGVSRGVAEAGGEPMKLRELTVPYVVQEVD